MAGSDYDECPWNSEPWSCTEDSSDTAPDPAASSAHEAFSHSHALSRVSLAPAAAPPIVPQPQPKAPPPQHLLSNAAQILPPLPAGPRHGVNMVFTPPMRSFCARYQNTQCRRQCSLHMTPLQRTHAHVLALHGLPIAALLPLQVRWRFSGFVEPHFVQHMGLPIASLQTLHARHRLVDRLRLQVVPLGAAHAAQPRLFRARRRLQHIRLGFLA